jgi:branched-chain amino acid transport system ATP-binding protein
VTRGADSGPPLLEVSGLTKAFGGLIAVNDLSFEVHDGEIVGLIGPNGSGKTTALNLITAEYPADAGAVRLAGDNLLGRRSYGVCRRRVSRTFQLVRVFRGMTVRDNVLVGAAFGSRREGIGQAAPRVGELLGFVGLDGRAARLADELTYIDQKRLELARALATDPRLLLLDEWLAGLNPTELRLGIELVRRTRERGISLIVVEHVMHAIRSLCDHVVCMNAGRKIAEGSSAEVLRDPEVVRAYLGDEADDHA